MGLGEGCVVRRSERNARDIRHLRRRLARLGAGGLLVIGVICTSPAVAAAGVTPPPAATADPVIPPTAPSPSGTNGSLTPGTSPPTPSPAPTASSPASRTASPTAASVATPQGTAVVMPLQPPTPDVPTGTAPATPTHAAPSPTAGSPTATTAKPTIAPTATVGPTSTIPPTASATGTPTSTPTGTPGANPASAELANFVLLEDPGIGGNALIARTAVRHFGEFSRPDGVPWTGWCEMFVGNVLYEAGIPHPRYDTAILDALSGPLYRGHAPTGSLVYFDQRSDPNGHVGIALGDGTMLSALGNGIVRSAYEAWPSYVGWRPYGTTAPPDQPFLLEPLLAPTAPQDAPLQMPPWPEQSRWYAPPPYIAPETATK
jgi:hypothetical protein